MILIVINKDHNISEILDKDQYHLKQYYEKDETLSVYLIVIINFWLNITEQVSFIKTVMKRIIQLTN